MKDLDSFVCKCVNYVNFFTFYKLGVIGPTK